MTDQQIVAKAVQALRPGDVVQVTVTDPHWHHTKLPWRVGLTCSRAARECGASRHGFTSAKLIGYCRTDVNAFKRAARVLRLLQKLRSK